MQLEATSPSSQTVQAEHAPRSQPIFVPVNPSVVPQDLDERRSWIASTTVIARPLTWSVSVIASGPTTWSVARPA